MMSSVSQLSSILQFSRIIFPRLEPAWIEPNSDSHRAFPRPSLTCGFKSVQERQDFFNNTIINDGIEVRGNFTSKDDLDSFFSTLNQTDTILKRFGQNCAEGNSFLKYLGTTAVARDIVSMSNCLEGPDSPVNYYGFRSALMTRSKCFDLIRFSSYGSVLGAYLVNTEIYYSVPERKIHSLRRDSYPTLPQHVGRIVIDGIVDATKWATESTFKLMPALFKGAEATLAGFTSLCVQAGPSNCSFATEGSTGTSLIQEITDLNNIAYDKHKAAPTSWDTRLAPQLVSIRNSLLSSENITLPKRFKPNALFERRSIPVDPALTASLGNVSRLKMCTTRLCALARLFPLSYLFTCHRFPVRAVERFTGPFNAKLANPILIIGNRADPRTPISNARKIAAALGSSARLLEQNGFGHTSLAENSDCTRGMVQKYLLTGELPEIGEVCNVNQALFPPNGTDPTASS
ncbi:hypothetical protein M422DRAFT_45262 [Sphaerobolus stellatus SS14]|nr:hypothetical protein M422DRAFT_45262 [Sphaerobolus stellatus SS14]